MQAVLFLLFTFLSCYACLGQVPDFSQCRLRTTINCGDEISPQGGVSTNNGNYEKRELNEKIKNTENPQNLKG